MIKKKTGASPRESGVAAERSVIHGGVTGGLLCGGSEIFIEYPRCRLVHTSLNQTNKNNAESDQIKKGHLYAPN